MSQINQWLNIDSEIQEDGPVHSNQLLEPINQASVRPSTQDQQHGTPLAQLQPHTEHDNDEEEVTTIKIALEYKLFFAVPEEKPTNPRQKKRKSSASNPKDKFKILPSSPGKLNFEWDSGAKNLNAFKMAAIKTIRRLNELEVAIHCQEQEDESEIIWGASIPHGGRFANKNKAILETNDDLSDFLEECRGPCDGRRFTVTMTQKDPRISAQVSQNLFLIGTLGCIMINQTPVLSITEREDFEIFEEEKTA